MGRDVFSMGNKGGVLGDVGTDRVAGEEVTGKGVDEDHVYSGVDCLVDDGHKLFQKSLTCLCDFL